jgi:hypothetical protein
MPPMLPCAWVAGLCLLLRAALASCAPAWRGMCATASQLSWPLCYRKSGAVRETVRRTRPPRTAASACPCWCLPPQPAGCPRAPRFAKPCPAQAIGQFPCRRCYRRRQAAPAASRAQCARRLACRQLLHAAPAAPPVVEGAARRARDSVPPPGKPHTSFRLSRPSRRQSIAISCSSPCSCSASSASSASASSSSGVIGTSLSTQPDVHRPNHMVRHTAFWDPTACTPRHVSPSPPPGPQSRPRHHPSRDGRYRS